MSIVLRRCAPARVLLCALLVFLSGGAGLAAAASSCGGDMPAIQLRIVAAGIAPDIDRTTVIRVYDDGCTQVHRPAYRRDAGEYRLDLDKSALDTLRSRVDRPALRSFDAKRLRSELAAADKKTVETGSALHSEPDADYYELRWVSAGKVASAGWAGLPAAAARHENATLKQMAEAVQAIESLAARSGAVRIEGGTP